MKLNITPRANVDADTARWYREIAQQVNGLSEGKIAASYQAATSAPTTGTWMRGDFVTNSAPEELGTAPNKYAISGWRCVAAGTPGTWVESRIPTETWTTADGAITQSHMKIKSVVALADAAATLTAAQLVDNGIFTITPTVARTLTTDTVANIVAALPRYQVGTWFDFTIVNTAAFDVTLAAGTGITLSGKAIINNVSGTWKARIDSATAITLYRT
jgi:hypothetical protein